MAPINSAAFLGRGRERRIDLVLNPKKRGNRG
jgi:hypothetical protein